MRDALHSPADRHPVTTRQRIEMLREELKIEARHLEFHQQMVGESVARAVRLEKELHDLEEVAHV